VVDVVGAEDGADHLLEEVVVLVRALGRAEPSQRAGPVPPFDLHEATRRQVQGLIPGGFAETLARIGIALRPFRVLGLAYERHGQPVRVVGVVEAVAPLDAQPAVVGRPIAPGDAGDDVALHPVRDATADAAVWADGIDRCRGLEVGDRRQRLVGERAGRAVGHTLAAGDAGRLTHRLVHVEADPRQEPFTVAADDLVHLDVIAGPDAAVAQDAGVVIDGDNG
jgi:hypothetical protein